MNFSRIRRRAVSVSTCVMIAMVLLWTTGCRTVGPRTVAGDRFDYSSAIAESWKKQTLLNIIKLRYMDLPVFVDVASVVAGYSLETALTAGGSFPANAALGGNTATVGGSARFTDRPTITYAPLTGEKFLRGFITPIDPKNIFFMLQSGYPADFILGLTVESLNDIHNRSASGGQAREADPDFVRVLELLREIQIAGAVGLRVEETPDKGRTTVFFFRREKVSPEILEKAAEVRRLLKMPAEGQRFKLTYSPLAMAEDELAVNSRSMLQIMVAFANYVDVPEAHLQDGSVAPGFNRATDQWHHPKVHVRCGKTCPKDAFAAVSYRDHWFWIEHNDWQTKRALTAVMFFFTLSEGGGAEQLPLITIPAQ